MKRTLGAAGLVAAGAAAAGYALFKPRADALEEQWSFVGRYCVDCHNDIDFTGDLSLQRRLPGNVHAEAEVWEKAIRKLEIGLMPPRDRPQPTEEERRAFVRALETTLDRAAAAEPYAGHYPPHRLNRAEYANAIRDLCGFEIDADALLPSDGGDFGFDNIASALTTSPLLLERYVTAALRIVDLAVGNADLPPTAAFYKIPVEVTQTGHMEGLPLGTRGGIKVRHTFPADAKYVFAGRLLRTVAEGYVGVEGHDVPHEFIVLVDGERVFSAKVGGPEDHRESSESITLSAVTIDERMTSPPIPITAGPHEVVFTWVEMRTQEQNVWQPALRETLEAHNPAGLPRLEVGIIEGPYEPTGISDTPSRERIFVCKPERERDEAECAGRIVAALARRAFRRPVDDEDIAPALELYREARATGGGFDDGIRAAVARVLVSPSFLYRIETSPVDVPVGASHPISDVDLASRLSFFLWSSIPDDELLELAVEGRLRDPDVLEAQVRRMVADERASALVENFTGQWLQLRNLEQRVRPDILMFPDFDANLRDAFRRETELLFEHVLRNDLPVHELLTANYTFVNERLARHYGIKGVYGSRFRKVELDDPNRGGLLGHGSFLSLTSAANRTSPIIRGKFVMANLLNSPPPEPPAVVPALEESAPKDRPSTVREQLERHRENPACNACHRNIDPVGFALENFGVLGEWRETTREGLPIDSAGILADGTPVDGPASLRAALLAKRELFASTVAEKLLTYALGRGLEPRDMPVVRSIVRNAARDDYRMMSIVLGIVDSYPFQHRTKTSEPEERLAQLME